MNMKCILPSVAQNSSRQSRNIIIRSKQQQQHIVQLRTNTTAFQVLPYSRCYYFHVNTNQSLSFSNERKRTQPKYITSCTIDGNAVFNSFISNNHYNNSTEQFSSSSSSSFFSTSNHDKNTKKISKYNQNDKEHNIQLNEDDDNNNTMITNPLSKLSSSDFKLAMDTIQNNEQQQHTQSQSSINININSIPGTSKGKRQLAIIYTCSICNTRSAKKFTERAYNHGVVLVRCPKCENFHLIADRLGYFTDDNDNNDNYSSDNDDNNNVKADHQKKGWDIEMFMKKINKQDNIKVMTHSSNSVDGESGGDDDDVLEVTVEDVVGETFMNEIKKGE